MNLYKKGNAVKVTYDGDELQNHIGVIIEKYNYEYIKIDFGHIQKTYNIMCTIDLTYEIKKYNNNKIKPT